MIKQNWKMSNEEKLRILNLHENATKKQYLIKEQKEIPFTIDFGNEFESGQYTFNPDSIKIISDKIFELSEYIKDKKIKNFKLNIIPGESRVTNQPPFEEQGSLARKRGEYLKDYLTKVMEPILGFVPEIVISEPIIGETPYNKETDFNKKNSPEYKKEQFVKVNIDITTEPKYENPNKGFVINVRGDEPGNRGAFYFPKSLDDWKKIVYDNRLAGFYSNAEQRGNNNANASVNMNHDVFLNYWLSKAKDLEEILGPAYIRNPKNSDEFILKQ